MDALDHGNTVDETDEAVLRMGAPDGAVGAASARRPQGGEPCPPHPPRSVAGPVRPVGDAREPSPRAASIVVEHAPRSVEEIHEAVLEALADESRHILEDGVVAEAADIDTCLLLGAGFPFWLGGITKHLDQTGVSKRVVGCPLARSPPRRLRPLPLPRRGLRHARPLARRELGERRLFGSEQDGGTCCLNARRDDHRDADVGHT